MSILLNTTGVVSSVTINDLGGVLFTHPISSYSLTDEWTYEEIQESDDLGNALDAGYVSITNAGTTVANSAELKLVQPQPDTVGSDKFSQYLIEGGEVVTIDNKKEMIVSFLDLQGGLDLQGILTLGL
jgi:hypothetical protein